MARKIRYTYIFKTISGLKVNYTSYNVRYARQRLASIYNVKQNDLKLVKRIKYNKK